MVFPLLVMTWIVSGFFRLTVGNRKFGAYRLPLCIAISALIVLTPLRGISIAEYILSVNPVFSIGSVCLVLAAIWKQSGGRSLLSELDLLLFSTWNIAVSLYLYLSYLGFIGYDLYSLGYGFSPLFVLTAFMTVLLFIFRSPVLWVFIAYILAFDLRLLSSDNFFDYITDGFLFIASMVILFNYIVKSIVSRPETGS